MRIIDEHQAVAGSSHSTRQNAGSVKQQTSLDAKQGTGSVRMDKIVIKGGKPLNGTIRISGAKNAALPLMAACLLTNETLTLENSPSLVDTKSMAKLLAQHGVDVTLAPVADGALPGSGRTVHLTAGSISSTTAPYDLVRKMRASVLVLGPLLARCGEAIVSLPGGCAIGTRPVDLHIAAMESLGADIKLEGGYIHAHAPDGLKGADITFPKVSVGATENTLMAASLAKGQTILRNAAREPEIADLAKCLNAMGAKITGIGSDTLTIEGVEHLHGATHHVVPDRIETGTYAIAAVITGGTLKLTGTDINLLPAATEILRKSGAEIIPDADGFTVIAPQSGAPKGVDVMTEPFPGFPTDLQAQFMTLMTVSHGAAMVTETIFENRFMHAPELMRMGADITVHQASALVRGVEKLKGAPVMATDLRASVSLILAGLAADGVTDVLRVYHLDRGYEAIEEKLRACGADITRAKE